MRVESSDTAYGLEWPRYINWGMQESTRKPPGIVWDVSSMKIPFQELIIGQPADYSRDRAVFFPTPISILQDGSLIVWVRGAVGGSRVDREGAFRRNRSVFPSQASEQPQVSTRNHGKNQYFFFWNTAKHSKHNSKYYGHFGGGGGGGGKILQYFPCTKNRLFGMLPFSQLVAGRGFRRD